MQKTITILILKVKIPFDRQAGLRHHHLHPFPLLTYISWKSIAKTSFPFSYKSLTFFDRATKC